jgi:repressor LexA
MAKTLHRLKEYLDYKRINISTFERSVGFSNGAFASQLKNDKTIGVDKLENILKTYPDINGDWLLTGEGEMVKGNIPYMPKEVKSVVNEPELHYAKALPLIPIDAMAGYANGDAQVMEYESEKFIVPTFRGADFLISVRGSSMYPKYNSGDIVACKRLTIDAFFQWNKVYVLDTNQGALIKRVRKAHTDDRILIVSDNVKYEPFELSRADIHALAIVMGVIRLE